ncbi:MAG: DUF1588 domain-containing protein [Hyphomicrobiaceae bacterium]
MALLEASRRYFPSDADAPATKRLFRLTRDQLDVTVGSLFSKYQLPSIKTFMNKDPLQTNYEYADLLSFNAANVDAIKNWVRDISVLVQGKPENFIDCSTDRGSDACLLGKAQQFVANAYRGDVEDAKIDLIAKFFLSGVKSVGLKVAAGELVEIVLSSTDFLFRKEIDVDRSRRLSPAQLLQALTYTVADAPPSALGFDTTQLGRYVGRGADTTAALDSVVSSGEARVKLKRFFKAWLEVKDPGDFTISQQVFPEFDAKLQSVLTREVDDYLGKHLGKEVPLLRDVTQSSIAFSSDALLQTYKSDREGQTVGGDGKAVARQRFGIFAQPAVLASHSGPTNSRPVKRGVFWVRKVMCMELDPPPPGVNTTIYETPHTTERQRIEQVTNQTACMGCHKSIDPFGFFQENYDALGRWRMTDNGHPIDSRVTVDFLDEGAMTTADPTEALRVFTNSLMFKQCFVRQMFRYYMGRSEDDTDDPLLRRMFVQVARNDDLLELVRMLASSDRIGRRQ